MATQCLNGNRFDFFNRTKLNGFGWVPKYYWDFGDGTHDYINTFTYGKTYTQAGTYTVSLVAESNYGCKDTNTLLVQYCQTANALLDSLDPH
jgi:PKD repeat protein